MKAEIKDKNYFFMAGLFGVVVLAIFLAGVLFGAGFEIAREIVKCL